MYNRNRGELVEYSGDFEISSLTTRVSAGNMRSYILSILKIAGDLIGASIGSSIVDFVVPYSNSTIINNGKRMLGEIIDQGIDLSSDVILENVNRIITNRLEVRPMIRNERLHDGIGTFCYNLYKTEENSEILDLALKCYEEELKKDPNSKWAWYNKACLEAIGNKKHRAFIFLEKAIQRDNSNEIIKIVNTDENFANLRNFHEFEEMIQKYV